MRKEKIFWGLFFILAAVFIVVGKLGVLEQVNLISLLLAILFGALCIKSLFTLEFPGVFFSLAFLGIIFDDELGITSLTPWTLLGAALLLSIGFSMIFRKRYYVGHAECRHANHAENCKTFNEQDGNYFDFSTSFSESIKYVNSDSFEGANLECNFGAMKVYFDNAILKEGNATVNIDASFAGVELFVPKEWKVVNQIRASLGGIEEKNGPRNLDSNQTLTLTGKVSFAGVTIIYI